MPVESNLIPDNWRERLAKVKAARTRLENYYGYLYLFKDKLRYGWQKRNIGVYTVMNNIGDAHAERPF